MPKAQKKIGCVSFVKWIKKREWMSFSLKLLSILYVCFLIIIKLIVHWIIKFNVLLWSSLIGPQCYRLLSDWLAVLSKWY